MMNENTLSTLGLCARARALACGTALVCESVRSNKAKLVLLSDAASQNTIKRVTNCCAYYGVRLVTADVSCERLGGCIGKRGRVSCVAISDENFARAISESIERSGR